MRFRDGRGLGVRAVSRADVHERRQLREPAGRRAERHGRSCRSPAIRSVRERSRSLARPGWCARGAGTAASGWSRNHDELGSACKRNVASGSRRTGASDAGFSLIETMIAMSILATGLLSLAGVFIMGLNHLSSSSASLIAREKAREAVESVHTARDTRVITWCQIYNVSSARGTACAAAPAGVFLDGPQPLHRAGDRRPGQHCGRLGRADRNAHQSRVRTTSSGAPTTCGRS